MGNWLPDTKPPWWGTIKEFGTHPVATVLGIVFGALVAGINTIVYAVNGALYLPFKGVLTSVQNAAGGVDYAVQNVASTILYTEHSVTGIFVDIGAGSGVAAPVAQAVIAFGAFAIVAILLWMVVQAVKLVNPQ